MAISALQIAAFVASPNFNAQVDGTVARTAIYRNELWAISDPGTRQQISRVATTPQGYGFTPVIVKDNNWTLTYDAWAADPPGADAVIESFVQTHWLLLTNIAEPEPTEPEA